MGLKLISAPATQPITLDQAKAHLRVVDSDEDELIAALVKSATQYVEAYTGRALVDQTWDLYLDQFPTTDAFEIEIPKPPLIEVTQIAYDNPAGFEQFVLPENYYTDTASEPGWVVPAGGFIWPTTLIAINSVRVRFRAGFMDTNSPPNISVPDDICAAVKLVLGTLYEQRESQVVGSAAFKLPWSIENLLRPHRVLLGMS